MKKIYIVLIALAGLMGMTACSKENQESNNQPRDIFYTVSEHNAHLTLDGTTVHLATEAEWDALLDRFCDYALQGEQVMFCGTHSPSTLRTKGNSSSPTSITTADRNELKKWMKEMETAGKTVRITYDSDSGTWHGTAYANLSPSSETSQPQTYSGTLVFVPMPALEEPPLGGLVWAMETSSDSTLILSLHGMVVWSDSLDDNMRILQGATITLDGVVSSYTDLQGNPFMTISLQVENDD